MAHPYLDFWFFNSIQFSCSNVFLFVLGVLMRVWDVSEITGGLVEKDTVLF